MAIFGKPDLMLRYPEVSDLRKVARKRIPHIAWEYLECGTGNERAVARNMEAFEAITLRPRFLKGEFTPDTQTTLFDETYAAPFGVAPIGLGGLVWPQAEQILATCAEKQSIPYCLSTVAADIPEAIGPIAGKMGWFQLYSPRDTGVLDDLLQRVKESGFKTLVVTVDIPAHSGRERLRRAGFTMPPRITPRFLLQGARHWAWSRGVLQYGMPRLRTFEKYANTTDMAKLAQFSRNQIGGTLSWDYLKMVRDKWEGPLIVKGVLHPDDAELALGVGVDGIQVSNHGGRQFNGAPAAIEALPDIVARVKGRAAILLDSGVRTGLDVMRALALGADFVLLGRAWFYGVVALGEPGADHVYQIILADLKTNMSQMGLKTIPEVKQTNS
ncbi:MAG: alpha-hydroxy acid oxidase [Chloroflexota bacterium]